MKSLSPDDRPREKLWRHGASALGDNELVALVIAHGGRHGSALAIANALLAAHGGLHGLVRCSCDDLARTCGIGHARAAQIAAALELGRRTLTPPPGERFQLRHPRDAGLYLMPRFGGRPMEHVGVLLLDSRHRVLRTSIVAVGSLNASGIEPREIY